MKSKIEILKRKFQVMPHEDYNPVHESMDEYAKELAIDYENWKKSHGIHWNIKNATTYAEELFELYLKEKGL